MSGFARVINIGDGRVEFSSNVSSSNPPTLPSDLTNF